MISVLYIAGAGRSGSTLLERILGQVEGAAAVGELRYLWQGDPTITLCSCGRLIYECDFWRDMLNEAGIRVGPEEFRAMWESQQKVDRIRYIPMMIAKSKAARDYRYRHTVYAEKIRRIYKAILERTGDKVIIDSSKDLSTLFLLTEMSDVRLQILHLVRDGRAVAFSWAKEKLRADVIGESMLMDIYSPRWSAADWMYRNVMTEVAQSRADGYLRLRYNDLVANPHRAIEEVATFMGLYNADLSFIQKDEVTFEEENHTIAGNPMRFEKGTIRVQLDNAWQHKMAQSDKFVVTALTWPLLRRYKFL